MMSDFINFVGENWQYLLSILLAVFTAFITWKRTGNIGNNLNILKGDFDMKFKKEYQPDSVVKQQFSEEVPDYVLNPDTNELEELSIPKNVQKYIDSYIDCALERILERAMPSEDSQQTDPVEEYTGAVQDLALLGEAMEQAEFYREKFGLSNYATIAEIYGRVDEQAKLLKQQIAEKNKEVKNNETSQEEIVQTEVNA